MNSFLIYACFSLALLFASTTVHAEDLIFAKPKQEEVLVVKVVSSDMIILENAERIKLIGIESFGAPPKKYLEYDEKGRPIIEERIEPTIPLEDQALAYARNLMEGQKVVLEYDANYRDEQGYKTAYVKLSDGSRANTELLRQGFVKLKIRPPNVKYKEELKNAYQEARKEQRGFLSY